MLHDQIVNFLEATVIFLLMTNAVSIFAATYAIRVATGSVRGRVQPHDHSPSPGGAVRLIRWQ